MKNFVLVSLSLLTVGLVLIESHQVFSSQADRLKLFHESIRLMPSDLAAGDILHERVSAFAGSVFQRSAEPDTLMQITATVRAQAMHEHWRGLTVDVWVGGKSSPAGYYLRYEAVDETGQPIKGEAFVATDLELVKASWPR